MILIQKLILAGSYLTASAVRRWFGRYKKELFVKLDVSLGTDENGMAYSAELLSRFDNPYFMPICESFKRTVSGEK